MNRSHKIFLPLLFLCLFPAFLAAREASDIVGDRFEEIAGRGLEIRTNPSGVKVYIDGVERAVTPVVFENLSVGEHSIRLSKDGYKDRRFNVTLFSTSRLVVSIKMEETRGLVMLSIYRANGSPQELALEPQIYTNTVYGIETPPIGTLDEEIAADDTLSSGNKTLLSLPTGYRTIRVRAFGWEDAEVSVLVDENNTVTADIYMKPAAFRLENISQSRKYFNPTDPGNLGAIEFHFEVSAPGAGTITITTDGYEDKVYEKHLDNFTSRVQSISWNGRDDYDKPFPEGIYTITIEASALHKFSDDSEETVSLSFIFKIDYNSSFFPLFLESGISGLTFAPMPNVLRAESYQLQASFAYAGAKKNNTLTYLPFEIGMRVSPIQKLEIATVFNINPSLKNKTGWGITGSAKYNFIGSGSSPFFFATGVSYTWASKNGESPLDIGRGIGFYTPLSLQLSAFSFILTPAIFWRGPEGFTPELLLSTGILYNGGWFNSGASMRCEFDFTKKPEKPRLLAGAQASFFLVPSNFLISLLAGVWTKDSYIGGYGGVKIGLIY